MNKMFLALSFGVLLIAGCAPGQILNRQTGIIPTSADCFRSAACRDPIMKDAVEAYKAGSAATPPVTPWLPIVGGALASVGAIFAGLWKHYKDAQAQRVEATTQILNAISNPPPKNVPVVATIK